MSVTFTKTGNVLEKSVMLHLAGTVPGLLGTLRIPWERFGSPGNAPSTSPTVVARFLLRSTFLRDSDLAYGTVDY